MKYIVYAALIAGAITNTVATQGCEDIGVKTANVTLEAMQAHVVTK